MEKIVWTKKHFTKALSDLGVVYSGDATNVNLDKLLDETIVERNPDASAEEREGIKTILFNTTDGLLKADAKKLPAKKDKAPKSKSSCPTFGKAFDPQADECVSCKDGAEIAAECKELTDQAKAKKASPKKKAPVYGDVLKKSYADFAELQKHLKVAPGKRITMAMNQKLLKGAKYNTLLKQMEEIPGNDFRSVSRIKAHIAYMKKQGFIFTVSGEKNDIVKLTGYQNPNVPVTAPVEEEKQAATA